MKFRIEYTVDTAMQDASARQSLYAIYLKPKIGIFVFLVVACIVLQFVEMNSVAFLRWLYVAIVAIVAIAWVRAYFHLIEIGRTRLALSSVAKTTLEIDDNGIRSETSTETKSHSWQHFDRTIETKDFIIVMKGKLSLFCLPKSHLPAEVQAVIKQRVRQGASVGIGQAA